VISPGTPLILTVAVCAKAATNRSAHKTIHDGGVKIQLFLSRLQPLKDRRLISLTSRTFTNWSHTSGKICGIAAMKDMLFGLLMIITIATLFFATLYFLELQF
jgi:hypothetical protein